MRLASLAFFLSVFWLLLSGHYTPMLLALGALSVLGVVALTSRMGLIDDEGHPIGFAWGAMTYWPWLAWEIAKSSVSVARIIWSPSLPISPRMVEVEGHQRTAVGLCTYGNSITLTPGTVTVGIAGQSLTVHALTKEGAEDVVAGSMDRRVKSFEGS